MHEKTTCRRAAAEHGHPGHGAGLAYGQTHSHRGGLPRWRRERHGGPSAGRQAGCAARHPRGHREQGRCEWQPGCGRGGQGGSRRLHPGLCGGESAGAQSAPGQVAVRSPKGHCAGRERDVFTRAAAGHFRQQGGGFQGPHRRRTGQAGGCALGDLGAGVAGPHHAGADHGQKPGADHPCPLQGRRPADERRAGRPVRGVVHQRGPCRAAAHQGGQAQAAGGGRTSAARLTAPGAHAGRAGPACCQPVLAVWHLCASADACGRVGAHQYRGEQGAGPARHPQQARSHGQRTDRRHGCRIRAPDCAGVGEQRAHHPRGGHPGKSMPA